MWTPTNNLAALKKKVTLVRPHLFPMPTRATAVHCVRVSLIGTPMVVFAAYGSVVGIVLLILYLLCVQYCGLLRGPLSFFYNGPTSWQCSQAYMCDLVGVHVIISFGDCSVSLSCPVYWAMPHCSVGEQHLV